MIGVSHVVELDINIWSVPPQVDSKIPNVRRHGRYTTKDAKPLAGISATREMVTGEEVAVVGALMALEHPLLMRLDPSHVNPVHPPKAHEAEGRGKVRTGISLNPKLGPRLRARRSRMPRLSLCSPGQQQRLRLVARPLKNQNHFLAMRLPWTVVLM